ncbi:hypothetical protein CR51_17320 [Caballeronia megalochromosomata]|nr:hypothetical protein CR51_17320 [Caballeronia megalochromosomata]
MHIAGGAAVAGLGGGSVAGGAAGAGISAAAAGYLNDVSNAVKGASPTGNADADRALGNILANVLATGAGAVVGGSTGASTASNTDMYNRSHGCTNDKCEGSDDASTNRLSILGDNKNPLSVDLVKAACGQGNCTDEQVKQLVAAQNQMNAAAGKNAVVAAGTVAAAAAIPALTLIPGAPIFGIDGVLGSGAMASAAGTGAISVGINAGSQYVQNGSVNPVDLAGAFAAGAAGTCGGLIWNMGVNAAGGAATTAINNAFGGKNDSIPFNSAVSTAGSAFGYGVGKGLEIGTRSSLSPSINSSDWADVGKWVGPSGRNIFTPNNLPAINSSVGGNIAGEFGNKETNDLKSQIGGKK